MCGSFFQSLAVVLMWAGLSAAPHPAEGARSASIEREVRHELLMLPYYDVFDDLKYRVDGGNVTLLGYVTRPTLKDDVEPSGQAHRRRGTGPE